MNLYSLNYGYPYYTKLMNFDAGASWSVFDAVDHVALQYTDKGTLPYINSSSVYNGYTVDGGHPLVLNLNADYFSNTDSVYIILPSYTRTPGKTYSISAGTLSFTRAELAGSYNYSYNSNLVIIAYRSQQVKINGKMYAFVREYKFIVNIYIGY